jgi:hypothetical protein
MASLWLRNLVAAVTALAFVAVVSPAAPASAANDGCYTNGGFLECPLQLQGTYYYATNNTQKAVRFTNKTGQYVQINQISGTPVASGLWGEYCTYRNNFATRQDTPGVGEVGCQTKEPSEASFPQLRWDGYATALSVAPDDLIYLSGYVSGGDYRANWSISTYPQSIGVYSYRQPRVDAVISGNGSTQWTTWDPWPNNTGHNLMIGGATIYASTAPGHTVDGACVYIVNTAGGIRWSYCTNIDTRGVVNFR